ncbi:ubiquitin-conjugating enzyme E2Q-like protein CG4502 [Procambarus clarkii]|uniref:ubiquitin-conjugating enzyme E2Q-like protein CG4502 n=1 Tax=Procambarus clarkii TaxID=6728 RepID=UPI003742953E
MRGSVLEAVREEESVVVEETERRISHHRQRCPSLHSLLRRQLLTQGSKMAAAFRKLFRSSDKLEPQFPPATPTNQSSARRESSSASRTSQNQPAGAWRHDTTSDEGEVLVDGGEGSVGGGASIAGLNSPSNTRRFFSRHTYLDGSRVGPSEGVVGSPKTSNRGKTSPSSAASAATAAAGLFKKSSSSSSAASSGLLNESTTKHMKVVRTRRLMKEFEELSRTQQNAKDPVFTVDLVNDCLYEWKVKLLRVDSDSELYRDMQELGIHHILLSLSFPENFPFHPPFLRVLSPRLEKGFVMEGGAICMELLTPRGWASAYTIEAVIMQFAASLVKGQGRISRKHRAPKEFNKRSAESAFRSLVKTHEKYGWVTPPLSEG